MSAQSQAEQVITSLQGQLHHLEKAGGTGAQAVDLVRRSGQQAIQVGYPRVAEGLHHIEGRLAQVHGILGQATVKAQKASTTASDVTSKTTPEDAAQMLQAASAEVDDANQTLLAVNGEIRKLEGNVMEVLRGAKPGPTLDLLEGMRKQLSEAFRYGKQAKEHCKITTDGGSEIGSGSGN